MAKCLTTIESKRSYQSPTRGGKASGMMVWSKQPLELDCSLILPPPHVSCLTWTKQPRLALLFLPFMQTVATVGLFWKLDRLMQAHRNYLWSLVPPSTTISVLTILIVTMHSSRLFFACILRFFWGVNHAVSMVLPACLVLGKLYICAFFPLSGLPLQFGAGITEAVLCHGQTIVSSCSQWAVPVLTSFGVFGAVYCLDGRASLCWQCSSKARCLCLSPRFDGCSLLSNC